jgi:hypothetical protein
MTPTIAVQYLEYHSPRQHTPQAVRQRLQAAFDRLPISLVLLGWNTPRHLADVCAKITAQHKARLFLWHPLLTSDGVFFPLPEWRTIGLNGESLAGFHGEPDFTFICPNHPAARQTVLQRLSAVLRGSPFQGIFLDRIRFPSPAAAPDAQLACFCQACRQAASQEGLDLDAVQLFLTSRLSHPEGCQYLTETLLNPTHAQSEADLFASFLDFRQRSITRIVREAASIATAQGMAVGLDCFSPCLTRMVGQDLTELNATCEWIKIMTYTHTMGPAGMPYELLGLAGWLNSRLRIPRAQILHCLIEASGLPLPAKLSALRKDGLPSQTIEVEIGLGRSLGVTRLLMGLALVDLPGVNSASAEQHSADLAACRSAHPDGLVLSWDLWHISPERLEQVAKFITCTMRAT